MFELINPTIVGKFDVKFDTSDPYEAAKMYWHELTKIISNEVPQTYFTLKNSEGKIFHFKLSEEKNGTNLADYTLTQITDVNESELEKLLENNKKIMYSEQSKQSGGRHRHKHSYYDDDDDDSSSSSSDSSSIYEKVKKYKKRSTPLIYFNYVPTVYKSDSVFIPTFITPYIPHYMEIGFSSALWK